MNRRSKNTNHNSTPPHNPGPSWQAPVHKGWDNLDESFWGENYPYSKQQKRANDQVWRPGDRARYTSRKPAEKFSSPKQQLYPWSTEKAKTTSDNSNDDSVSTGLLNGTTSSTNTKENKFLEGKNIMREQNKQLLKGLSKPVECSIAERMMQKMGWQGGGLGVKEEGRTEPIEVNLKFINKTTGLGHNEKKQQKIPPALPKLPKQSKHSKQSKQSKIPIIPVLYLEPVIYLQPVTLNLNQKQPKQTGKKKKKIQKESVDINNKKSKRNKHETINHDILDTILDFVMDVKQIEYGFDINYSKKKRRIIHNFVEYLREGANEEIIFDFDDQHLDKIEEINEYNNYVLITESQGAHPNRQLFIYKEAPDEVYLVTRDDLIDDKENGGDDDDKVINNSEIVIAETVIKKTAKKTADLIIDTKTKVVENDSDTIDLGENSIKDANNMVVNSILMEIVDAIPKKEEAQFYNNNKTNKSDNKDLKEYKTKNKHSVANFIENCSKELNNVETNNLNITTINKANLLENNLKESNNYLNKILQDDLEIIPNAVTNDKDEKELKDDEIIEIDLTESEDVEIPEHESHTKTTEIKEDVNEIDVELAKLRGKPKLEHLEEALYIYLRDFLKHDVYTEIRFLGDFGDDNDEENELLTKLLDDICDVSKRTKNLDSARTRRIYKELYNNETYYLQLEKDRNGGNVLLKISRHNAAED